MKNRKLSVRLKKMLTSRKRKRLNKLSLKRNFNQINCLERRKSPKE